MARKRTTKSKSKSTQTAEPAAEAVVGAADAGGEGAAELPAAPRNEILLGDCLDLLPTWRAGTVDLVFADPPYNIGYKYHGYNDRLPRERYLHWTKDWIASCERILAPHGSIYIAIGDEYAAEVRLILRELGLVLRNWIIWHYTFGQACKNRFSRSHAHIFYACKDAKDFVFNADDPGLRVKSARQLVYNDSRANPAGKLPNDTWDDISRVCGTFNERVGWHPCQMPEALLERVIRASSRPGDLVFDPFAGSGTTCVVAKRLGRDYLGTDITASYVGGARKRVAGTRE